MKETIYHLIKQEIDKGVDFCNLEEIRQQLNVYAIKHRGNGFNDDAVLEFLENKFNVLNFIKTKSREPRYVWARNCFFWYKYDVCKNVTYQEIGDNFGNYSHCTMMYAINKIRKVHRSDLFFKEILEFKALFL